MIKLMMKNEKKIQLNDVSYNLFSVFTENENGECDEFLFQVNSEIENVKRWYLENIFFIKNDELPVILQGKNPLREMDFFYENADFVNNDFVEELHDEILNFRIKHDLHFCFEGSDVSSYLIGLNSGRLQLSFLKDSA